jgi:hypothetical protein
LVQEQYIYIQLISVIHSTQEIVLLTNVLVTNCLIIRRFGTWPVPVPSHNTEDGGVLLQGPVCREGQVVGWHTSEADKPRRFHVPMSGFAFNSTMLWDPRLRSHLAWNSIRHHPHTMTKQGYQAVSFFFLSSPVS